MSKSKIEWCDYSANPVKGLCPVGCSYCYARRLYGRFKWNPEVRLDPYWWGDIAVLRKPSRIFVGSTMELFGPWVTQEWLNKIIECCRRMHWHTFIFLTKKPENLPHEWPANCWVGVSVESDGCLAGALAHLPSVEATVKFLSVEPLLRRSVIKYWDFSYMGVNWLIIGQQTPVRKSTMPKVEWIQEIALAATKANVPLFIKDNLKALLPNRMPFWCAYRWWSEDRTHQLSEWRLRQELPVVQNTADRSVCPGMCSVE